MYLKRYPTQYINCMTSDSEFVAFVNHAIQLTLDLMAYPNIWAVLLIPLETLDVNALYVQVIHDYYNECYNTKTEECMTGLEQAAERSKNMYNNNLEGVSAYIQQQYAIHKCSQQINMRSVQRITHKYHIILV